MKTVKDVNLDIKDCMKESQSALLTDKDKKKIAKKVEFYNSARLYLEFHPSSEYIKKEKERLNMIVQNCNDNILKKGVFDPKDKKKMHDEAGSTLAKKQLKVLNYIL